MCLLVVAIDLPVLPYHNPEQPGVNPKTILKEKEKIYK
jgi:hypothetical protein